MKDGVVCSRVVSIETAGTFTFLLFIHLTGGASHISFVSLQAFIQPQTCKNNYWIGLSYDDREQKWKWIDTGPPFGM